MLIKATFAFLMGIGITTILFFAMLGFYTLVCIFKAKRLPMDTSNRINHIRLWWFVLTRPELFVGTFAWLKNDEYDNSIKQASPDGDIVDHRKGNNV
jgi:hypothetical protein